MKRVLKHNPARKLAAVVWCAGWCAAVSATAPAASTDELLPNDQAFRVTAQMKSAKEIALDFRIADGYYMYRNRFKFEPVDGAKLGRASTPPGKVKQDATFGRVETYRKTVRVVLPLLSAGTNKQEVRMRVISQGCADAGVCYPPQKHVFTIATNEKGVVEPLVDAAAAKPSTPDPSKPAGSRGSSIADIVGKRP
jgi:thioredoxin:protein disulfide reductase